jgi:hypothetical protein
MSNQVNAGDIIKSFDFRSRTDCYIVGQVKSINNNVIIATVIRAVSEGKEYNFLDTEFSTLEQGHGIFDDEFTRIETIG